MASTAPPGPLLAVREVYPNGGPFAGGTVVSLNVTSRGALSPSELRCRFGRGDGGLVYDFPSVVAAEFADSRWRCAAPPFHERQRSARHDGYDGIERQREA